MRRAVIAALGAGLFLAVGIAAPSIPLAQDDSAAVIAQRRALMRANGMHAGAINDFVEKGMGEPAAVAVHAVDIAAIARSIPALFPQGTSMDDNVGQTGAKPAIWTEWEKFQAAAKTLEEESLKLFEVAQGGDKDAIAAQFAALGKDGCGGCHTPYRQKLDE
jgi:cytochrome c556